VSKRVLVLGDLIIDEFYRAESMGVSPAEKAVTGKYNPSTGYQKFFGGAGLVARHLLRLGCNVTLATFCGSEECLSQRDFAADQLTDEEKLRFDYTYVEIPGWRTTTKRRFYVGNEKILKLNTTNDCALTQYDRDRFMLEVGVRYYNTFDAVVICDNGHGAVDYLLARQLVKHFVNRGLEASVCCQGSYTIPNYSKYDGCRWVFMNEKEWQDGCETFSAPSGNLIVTLGDRGAEAWVDHKRTHSPAKKIEAKDTLGAGDAFMAAFVACPSRDLTTRLDFANEWAARACMEEGTRVPR
jgi:bifunctional ADP-heptose synthase (sugar kinase/adenylyltransferase)